MALVRLLSMTVLLSTLIWASADSLVNETTSVRVAMTFVAPPDAPDAIIDPVEPLTPFEIQLSGPRRAIEEIRSRTPLQVRFRVSDHPTGRHTLRIERRDLRKQMADQLNLFSRVSIVSIQPETVDVNFDQWVRRSVEVVWTQSSLAYDLDPRIDPANVSVRMRDSEATTRTQTDAMRVDISTELGRALRDSPRPPGEPVTVSVPLDPRSFGEGATFTPGVVSVTATVKSRRAVAQIPTVPILLAVAFANLEQPLRPVTRDGLPLPIMAPTITVSGPPEEIARLVRGATRAFGIIHLKQSDLEQLGVLKLATPEFHLPPGIELVGEAKPVEFKLINAIATDQGG